MAMANHHLMLEKACCVPLDDVHRQGREEMHALPCLEQLWVSTGGRSRLLECHY
jgi:hypothetical protein